MVSSRLPFQGTLAALLFLTAALAGCAGTEETQGSNIEIEPEDPANGDPSPPPATEGGKEPAPKKPGANATETEFALPRPALELSTEEAEAPADINFTVDAEFDEGDELTWALDVTGNGEPDTEGTQANLPFTYTHSFTEAGEFNITFTVTGKGGNATETAVLTILEAAEEGLEGPVTYAGDVAVFSRTFYVTGATSCVSWQSGSQGIDCIWFELQPEYEGMPFTTDGPGDVDLQFRSDCTTGSSSVAVFGNDGHESGDIPAGAGCVVLADFLTGGTVSITIG